MVFDTDPLETVPKIYKNKALEHFLQLPLETKGMPVNLRKQK